MELQQIKAFIDAMASSDLTELEASKDGWTLRLVRRAARAPNAIKAPPWPAQSQVPVASAAANDTDSAVRAPLSGILYLSPSPDAAPFVVAGQAVKAGDTLCIIEAMKVFNTIRAEQDGIIEAVMARPGHEVDAGELLMRFAPQ